MSGITKPFTVKEADSSGWKIDRQGTDGLFMLIHPRYEAVTDIPTFDEACRLKDAFRTGALISFIRGYENFLVAFKRRIG